MKYSNLRPVRTCLTSCRPFHSLLPCHELAPSRLTAAIRTSQGFRDGRPPEKARFRDEDEIQALSVAHPSDGRKRYPPSLRLFCLRYQDVAILGAGGIKRTRTLLSFRASDPEAERAVRIMKEVQRRFTYRLQMQEIQVRSVCMTGDLAFPTDDYA